MPASNSPSISVIVRTIDRNELLAEALESLARQTSPRFEAVVVDMSAGSASSVIEPYRRRLSNLRHLDVGRLLRGPVALNYGVAHASADKIAILDDDNLYDPRHVAVLVDGLERTGADLVYTGVRRTTYTPDGDLVASVEWRRPFDLTTLLVGNYIHTSGTAFWKRTWDRVGGFDARFPAGDDHDFLLRVATAGTIASLPETTAESRSFSGRVGLQHHATESKEVRRCQAGLYWKHRWRYLRAWRRIHAERFNEEGQIEPRARESVAARWARRGRVAGDLVGWWYQK